MKLPKTINEKIADMIRAELKKQGHYDTGELSSSIQLYNASVKNENILQAFALSYIDELEHGVPANKIRVSLEDFDNLKEWVKRKIGAFSEAEATGIASAIVSNWKKNGKPSPNSKEFSETGEVLNAIKITFEDNEDRISEMVFDAADSDIDAEFIKTKSGTI